MKRLLYALCLVGLVTVTGCANAPVAATAAEAGPTDAGRPSVSARGVGKVTGTPDIVIVTLGVETSGPSAKAALDANNGHAATVIDLLKRNGVADADLRTSQLSVSPSYSENGRINGYQVSNLVTATLRDIAASGGLIDAVAEAVGDAVRVQQLSFGIDDDSGLRAQARADAVRKAQDQARQMAEAAGVALGEIRSITAIPQPSPGPYPQTMDARSSAAGAPVPLAPGSQDVEVAVDVVYDLG